MFFLIKSKEGFPGRKLEKKPHNVEMWEAENEHPQQWYENESRLNSKNRKDIIRLLE